MATFAARALKELATKQGPGLVQVRRISRRPLSGPFSRPPPPPLSLSARARGAGRLTLRAPLAFFLFSALAHSPRTHARTHARSVPPECGEIPPDQEPSLLPSHFRGCGRPGLRARAQDVHHHEDEEPQAQVRSLHRLRRHSRIRHPVLGCPLHPVQARLG